MENNCTSDVAIAYPEDLIKESRGIIIALYTVAGLILLTCFILHLRYMRLQVFKQRSEQFRNQLFFLNFHYFFIALFSSVPLFLPASQEFSQTVQKVVFASGMVSFFQLTLLQLGGEKSLLKKQEEYQINLGSQPLCCLAPFSCSKGPLTPKRLYLLRSLLHQMPIIQFSVLYILMSLKLSNVLDTPLGVTITTIQTVSWLAGMWGMGILKSLIGSRLDKSEFKTRQMFVQTMALLIQFQHVVIVKILGAASVYPCFSEHIPGGTFAALLESSLVLLWCFIFAIWEHRVYVRVTASIESPEKDCEIVITNEIS